MTPNAAARAIPLLNRQAARLGLRVLVAGLIKHGEATLGVFDSREPGPFIANSAAEIRSYLESLAKPLPNPPEGTP